MLLIWKILDILLLNYRFFKSIDQETLIAKSEFRQNSIPIKKGNSKCNYCCQKGQWVKTRKK